MQHSISSLSIFILFTILIGATSQPSSNNRAKRFAGFGGLLSTVGGNFGCVVSQDKLYINGRFTKSLNEDEQEEMRQYKQALNIFKVEVKAFVEQRQRIGGVAVGAGDLVMDKKAATADLKQPEPPKRPSFCSEKATTQFVFDGCTVQGDNIFIGENFVRKLTASEQQELAQFEVEFTAYQESVSASIKKQMEQFFNRQLGVGFSSFSMFGNSSSNSAKLENETMASRDGDGDSAELQEKIPKEPKTPEFCTLIA